MADTVEPSITQGLAGALHSKDGWKTNGAREASEILAVERTNGAQLGEDGMFLSGSGGRRTRYRPRTFPYRRYLPYTPDGQEYGNLETAIKKLYVAVAAGDFIPGATHWTREIRGWMQLKFDLPLDTRVKLVKLYFELSMAPGMESPAAERFSSMFMQLTK